MPTKKNQKTQNKQQNPTVIQRAPAAVGTKKKTKAPKVEYKADGSCVISHYEYMFDVDAGAADYVETVMINPQNATAFTWLAAIATRFEMYKFRKLKFHYKPSAGTDTSGWVVVGFDFDAYDDNTPIKAEMLAWKYSQKCAPWQSCVVDVSNDSRITTYRYADGGPPGTARGDLRLDFLGKLIILAHTTATMAIGEIFVDYTVEFRQPSLKIPPALYASVDNSTPMSTASDWFNQTSKIVGNMLLNVVDGNTLSLTQKGKFLLDVMTDGTPPISGGLGVTMSQPADNPSAKGNITSFFAANDSTAAIQTATYKVDVDVPPMHLNFADVTGTATSRWLKFATYDATDVL